MAVQRFAVFATIGMLIFCVSIIEGYPKIPGEIGESVKMCEPVWAMRKVCLNRDSIKCIMVGMCAL